MEFVVIMLKKSGVRSVTAAQLRSVLIKSKLARNSATLKLIPYFLKCKGQAVATFVERKSRLTIVKRLHGRDSQSMTQAVLELASQLQDKFKTLTVDHGKEFANYQTIEQLTGTQVYFAHAYSPHERDSNENRNRVLRRFIPKGQAIEELSDYQLVQINWHTPIEIFLLNLRH